MKESVGKKGLKSIPEVVVLADKKSYYKACEQYSRINIYSGTTFPVFKQLFL